MRTQDVLNHFGSQQAVADFLGVTQPTVSRWGAVVPRAWAFELMVRTGGMLQADPSVYIRRRGRLNGHGRSKRA